MIRRTHRPSCLKDALACRQETGGCLYAGGTDLMVRERRWKGVSLRPGPDVILIGHLEELREIRREGDRLVVGACTTLSDLRSHRETPPLFSRIIGTMASPAVRNVATIGGNICNASPAGDTLPWLYALGARVCLESAEGRRETGIEAFIRAPGQNDLGPHEILTAVSIPCETFTHECHQKVAARRANSPAKLSFLGLANLELGRLTDIRLAFGAVGPTVVRSPELEREFVQLFCRRMKEPSDLRRLLAGYAGLISPIDDQRSTADYRRQAALRLAEAYLRSLWN